MDIEFQFLVVSVESYKKTNNRKITINRYIINYMFAQLIMWQKEIKMSGNRL